MTHDPGGRRKPRWLPDSVVTAEFSDCERYRYCLSEVWETGRPLVMFLMMNPSVAGPEHADPTLIKTGKYARAWGYGGQLVGNVHAYRVTDSGLLVEAEDPVGPKNDAVLLRMARRAAVVVLAFGLPPKPLRPRAATVIEMLRGTVPLKYLHKTKNGTPCHPLYLRGDLGRSTSSPDGPAGRERTGRLSSPDGGWSWQTAVVEGLPGLMHGGGRHGHGRWGR